tara:strand:- start:6 stop:1016 length:1011 start_codon:yes stop_codon:yes gene_type:complete
MKKFLLYLYLILMVYSQPLLAAEESILKSFEYTEGGGNSDIDFSQTKKEVPTKITLIDDSHDWLKDYIDGVSYSVDSFFVDTFFGDDVIDDEISGTRAKLSFFTRREIGQLVDYNYGISVRLVLPNTDERFSLLVQSTEDDDERQNNAVDTVEDVEYSTALRFMLKATENWNVSFDNGVKWGLPVDFFSRLRFRRLDYFEAFNTRITQKFEWSVKDGLGESTRLQINRPLNIDRLIRFEIGSEYQVDNGYFEFDYRLSLYHELNPKEALAYYLRASGEDHNNMSFNNYGVGFRYRRMVYQDWVFVEVTPELEVANTNYYDLTPIIMFRFEALIGGL